MSFDSTALGKLTLELQAVQKREREIIGKLQQLFAGQFPMSGMVTAGRKVTRAARKAAKAGTAKKAKGPKAAIKGGESLQTIVLHAMGVIRTPKTALQIAEKIRTKRAQTTNASVASVLYQLAKRGKVLRAEDNLFYLPVTDAGPTAPETVTAASGASAALTGPPQTVTPGLNAGPAEVLEDA